MKGCFTILTIKLYILSNYIVTSLILLFFVIVIIYLFLIVMQKILMFLGNIYQKFVKKKHITNYNY